MTDCPLHKYYTFTLQNWPDLVKGKLYIEIQVIKISLNLRIIHAGSN